MHDLTEAFYTILVKTLLNFKGSIPDLNLIYLISTGLLNWQWANHHQAPVK